MTDTTSLAEKLTAHFKDTISGCETDRDQITLMVTPSHLLSTCEALRDEDDFSFSQLFISSTNAEPTPNHPVKL